MSPHYSSQPIRATPNVPENDLALTKPVNWRSQSYVYNTLFFHCSKNRRNLSNDSSYSKSLNSTLEAQSVKNLGCSPTDKQQQTMLLSKILSRNSFIYYQTLNGHTFNNLYQLTLNTLNVLQVRLSLYNFSMSKKKHLLQVYLGVLAYNSIYKVTLLLGLLKNKRRKINYNNLLQVS